MSEEKKINVKDLCPCINPFDTYNLKIINEFGNGDFENLPCYEFFKKTETPCVSTYGSIDKKIVLLGQNPGENEVREDKPFVGESGKKLWNVLEDLGYKRADFYITNAIKCFARTEEIKKSHTKTCSIAILRRELALIEPELIICLGRIAFEGLQYALLGKVKYNFQRGTVIEIESPVLKNRKFVKVCCTYHPSHILRNPYHEPIFAKDLSTFLKGTSKTIEYEVLDSYEKVEKFVDSLITKKEKVNLVIDLETFSKDQLDYKNNRIFCIGLAYNDSKGYVIPLRYYDNIRKRIVNYFVEGVQEKVVDKVKQLLLSPNIGLIGHNIIFDCSVIYYDFGINVMDKVVADTMVYHHLLRENPPHDLKTLTILYTPFGNYYQEIKDIFRGKAKKWYEYVDWEELYKYCAYDCCVCYYLWQFFEKRINAIANSQRKVRTKIVERIKTYYKLKKPYIHFLYTVWQLDWLKKIAIEHYKILFQMQLNGLPFSLSYVKELDKKVQEQIKEKANQLNAIAGKEINWNSTKQIGEVFNSLGIQSPVKTAKGNQSFNEEALKKLSESGVKLAKELLEYRNLMTNYTKFVKLIDKYKYRWIETEDKDIIRIACRINITGTETGRLSTTEPAFHQIPRDNTYRNMIVAREGWEIVSADYSTADLRFIAWYANCRSMIEGFESGVDFHRWCAAKIFNKDPEDVTKEERQISKSINFGVAYLMSAYSLSQTLKIPIEKAQEFIDKWFEDKPEVRYFIDMLLKKYESASEGEEVTYCNIFGRCRRVVRVKKFYFNPNTGKRRYNPEYGHIERSIVNFYPQSSVADTLAIAVIRMNKKFIENGLENYVKMLLTIHDAVLLEVKKEYVDKVCEIVKESMEFPIPFPYKKLILPVDFTVGKCWYKD